jgi:hypothetical protein
MDIHGIHRIMDIYGIHRIMDIHGILRIMDIHGILRIMDIHGILRIMDNIHGIHRSDSPSLRCWWFTNGAATRDPCSNTIEMIPRSITC